MKTRIPGVMLSFIGGAVFYFGILLLLIPVTPSLREESNNSIYFLIGCGSLILIPLGIVALGIKESKNLGLGIGSASVGGVIVSWLSMQNGFDQDVKMFVMVFSLIISVVGFGYYRSQKTSKATVPQVSQLTANQATTSPSNLEAEIQKAKDMLDKGLIDEEEFKVMKKKIIERS